MRNKKAHFSEWFSEIIAEAELADLRYNVKGFLVHRPWSVLAMKAMYRLYEKELERKGHKPVLFPAVIPEKNFMLESDHVEGFIPEVLWVTHGGRDPLEEKLALRPTSETAMYSMYALWIRSWRDMPLKLYQSCQVWRHETKATRPFIRGREFHWIEAHNAFSTKKESEDQVIEDMETTEKIMHQKFGIPFIFMKRPQWDKFPGAENTFAADTIMPDGKILQQPSTHLLGQNFSKPFGIKFMARDEKEEYAWQTCYGPCIWRMFASVIATHGDDSGLIFPWDIAPVQVIIIPIYKEGAEKVLDFCKKLKEKLSEKFRVDMDLTENSPGWKFNQSEMKGVPVRIEIGPKELEAKKFTVFRRDTKEKAQVAENNLEEFVGKTGHEITKNLVKKADDFFNKNISSAKSMDELEKKLKQGGLVKVDFCSTDSQGKSCADKIKEKMHGDVRGERVDKPEKPTGKCVACGKKACNVVYIGKSY